MLKSSLSPQAKEIVYQDAIDRDLTTARRAALLELLWNERFLTREQLITRVEQRVRKHCFGKSAWEDNFFRDVRLVKKAFHTAGFELAFSRSKREGRGGYYLSGQPALSPELDRSLKSSVAEVDPRQVAIYHQLSPASRFHQGSVLSDTARSAVAFRIQQENPPISPAEANRMALQRAYRP